MDYFLDRPEIIKISLTNVCNYKCIMCYNPKLKQKRGFIEDDLLFKILDDCAKSGIKQISLGATGEPLLHKNYLKYLQHAKARRLWVSTTTNCSGLTKEIAEAIIHEKLDRLNISIYSSNFEEHQKYTRTDCFDQVVVNVKNFLELWHECKSNMELNMWFLQIPEINNYERYLEQWGPLTKKIGIQIPLKDTTNWTGKVDFHEKELFSVEKDSNDTFIVWNRKSPCPHVRYYLNILHNGDVLPCCAIPEPGYFSEILFGNLMKESIMDVWRSDKYMEFKSNLYHKKLSMYRPCKKCSEPFETIKIRLSFQDMPQRMRGLIFRLRN